MKASRNVSRRSPVRGSVLSRALLLVLLTACCALSAQAAGGAGARPEYEFKLATLAPENSTLMQIFNEMNAELLKETEGKVGFKMFAGFVQGDEEDVLRKLRVGMLHAATFTMTALTDINPDLRALQIPFLFNNYEEVDYVMDQMESDLKQGFAARGYEILGWPELGFLYFMSTSPVASLEDLKGKKVWVKANTPMAEAIIKRAGVATVTVNAPDILMALQTNLVEVVYNSPYYALITQWYTQIKAITDLPLSYIGGALMVDQKAFSRMPAPLQETTRRVCARHLRRLTEQTRKDNAEAFEVILKRGIKRVTPSPAQVQAFEQLSAQAMDDLGPKFLPSEAVRKVRAALAEFKARR